VKNNVSAILTEKPLRITGRFDEVHEWLSGILGQGETIKRAVA
jgi:hypothetical protein